MMWRILKMEQEVKIILTNTLGLDPDDVTEDEYIDKLEEGIMKANEMANQGIEFVPDAIYDTWVSYLKSLKPDSSVLHQVWSEDVQDVDTDIDKYLVKYPMLSIQTIKDISEPEVQAFVDKMPMSDIDVLFSLKENGHGIRVVYQNGKLIKATSRGRSTNGRDLTRQLKLILGVENANLVDYDIVELRGEVLLPFSNLDKAKVYNSEIKSAFSGVASMLRDSASEEETKLLKFVAYDILCDEMQFNTLTEKFEYLEKIGFEVPMYFTVEGLNHNNFKDSLVSIIDTIAAKSEDYDYYTDGLVATIDNIGLFNTFGAEDKFRLGNLAFKVRRWEQNVYAGRVREVIWKPGKNKLTPVCVVEDVDTGELGVMTGTGNMVRNVPMYAPCYLLVLEAYIGNIINFKYGGEAGVVPCYPSGLLVTDKSQLVFDE